MAKDRLTTAREWLGDRLSYKRRFGGDWDERLAGLFDAPLDYAGKSVLDAGCNMGIILYEISKRRPASLHGIDRYSRALTVAKRIFSAVDIPHRFDAVDFLDDRRVAKVLEPSYDIVLLMAVWQHIYPVDAARAEQFLARLVSRCKGVLVYRGANEWGEHFVTAIAAHGYELTYRGAFPANKPILIFKPVGAGG